MMNRRELETSVNGLINRIKHFEAMCRDSSEMAKLCDLPDLLILKASLENNLLKKIADLPEEMPPCLIGAESQAEVAAIDAIRATYNHLNKLFLSSSREFQRLTKKIDKVSTDGIDAAKVVLKKQKYDHLLLSVAEKIACSTNPHHAISNQLLRALTSVVSQRINEGEPLDAYHKGVTIVTLIHKYSEMGFFSSDGILKGVFSEDDGNNTFIPLPPYPSYYVSDSIFRQTLHDIDQHRAVFQRFFTAQVTAMGIKSTDNCQAVIVSLEAYYRKDAELCTAALVRHRALVASQDSYNCSVGDKKQFLSHTHALRTMSAEDLRVISSHDSSLGKELHGFQEGVTRWDHRFEEDVELVFTKARGADVDRLMCDLTEGHMLGIRQFATKHGELRKSVEALRDKMKQDIGNAHAAFQDIYASYDKAFWEHSAAADNIRSLKGAFDQVAERLGAEESFVALDTIARELIDLTRQLKPLLKEVEEVNKAQLRAEIATLKDDRNQRIREVARRKQDNGFQFNSMEGELYQKVISFHVDADVSALDYKALARKRSVLIKQRCDVEACEAMIELHQFVMSNLIGPNMGVLLGRINAERDPTALLSVIGHYVTAESDFLSRLSRNLHLIQPAKLLFIQGLLTNREGDNVDEIKRKLAFMALQGLPFPARSFLQNPDAISAALLLEELGSRELITLAVLSNGSFCKAVHVLKQHNVTIDADNIRGLVGDKNKCEIICQQEQLYQDQMRRNCPECLTPEIYKALLQWFLAVDGRVSKAVNKVRLDMPDYFTPLLWVLIKENKTLRDLICDEPLHHNAPFLLPMLKRLTAHQMAPAEYLGNYLCPQLVPAGRGQSEYRQENRAIGKEEIHRAFSPDYRDQKILEILMEANQPSLQRSRFRKMSSLMTTLNDYVDQRLSDFAQHDEKYTLEKQALEHFRRDSVLLLLSKDCEEKKKVNFEKLAYKHFQHPNYAKNVLLDVLQFITGLFVIVMPCRYLLKQTLFFSAAKSDLHQQASQVLHDALVDLPRRVLERSSSSVPSG